MFLLQGVVVQTQLCGYLTSVQSVLGQNCRGLDVSFELAAANSRNGRHTDTPGFPLWVELADAIQGSGPTFSVHSHVLHLDLSDDYDVGV